MEEELKKLNQDQLLAVKHDQGPLLLVAGAGTGKTTVLINRLAYLVKEEKAKTDEILLTTFTEKAANEMIERTDRILPYGYVDLWIHTFHGFAERVLRQHGLEIGLNTDFKLLDATAQWVFLKKNIEALDLKYYHSSGNPNKFIADLLGHFSRLKDENISQADYETLIKKLKKEKSSEEADLLEIERLTELSSAYVTYEKLLRENNFLDFGDLIVFSIKLFKERPNILKLYQQKFKYFMVDEFQDTNFAQYELIKILAGQKSNLMVVGDDDQSIYKFRGASISNIMQFKDDYPQAKEIVLNKNYRSRQEILDCAYNFIQHNNPNRLEAKLKIDKKLKACLKFAENELPVQAFNFASISDELNFVSAKIMELYNSAEDINWSDFAILSRTNNTAENFAKELNRLNIPNHFVSLRGLYQKSIVLNVISYLKVLNNYKDSSALFRLLNMPDFKVSNIDLVNINAFAKRNYYSLFEALKNIELIKNISATSRKNIKKLLELLDLHMPLVLDKTPTHIFIKFIYDSNLLKKLDHEKDKETFSYLNQFYQKIKKFEEAGDDLRLADFIETLDLELEAGDTGSLRNDFVDVDTVKIMTVHSAKGLEFKYVFLVDLVELRFPSSNRSEGIMLHPDLIKEKIAENENFHIEEERRLFYVALTRAKEALFLSSAKDFGGAREKRPSIFLREANLEPIEIKEIDFSNLELLKDMRVLTTEQIKLEKKEEYQLPKDFSFSQFAAFDRCPLQYKYAHILKIPSSDEAQPSLVFGRVIHDVLYQFMLPLIANNDLQADLFSQAKKGDLNKLLSEAQILAYYKKFWKNEGYGSEAKKDEYFKKGYDLLVNFVKDLFKNPWPEVYFLEKGFRFMFKNFFIKGKIDRIDKIGENSFEIIDYKTGSAKKSLSAEDKRQLLLYQMVVEASFGLKVDKLSFYYLEDGQKVSFTASEKDMAKLEEFILEIIEDIQTKKFPPNPSPYNCPFCDFKGICEYRQ